MSTGTGETFRTAFGSEPVIFQVEDLQPVRIAVIRDSEQRRMQSECDPTIALTETATRNVYICLMLMMTMRTRKKISLKEAKGPTIPTTNSRSRTVVRY